MTASRTNRSNLVPQLPTPELHCPAATRLRTISLLPMVLAFRRRSSPEEQVLDHYSDGQQHEDNDQQVSNPHAPHHVRHHVAHSETFRCASSMRPRTLVAFRLACQAADHRFGDHSTAKTFASSEISRISNNAALTPVIPGDPSGMPGSEMPLIFGRSARSFLIALAGTCPSTT
jgi:hypothetical protein